MRSLDAAAARNVLLASLDDAFDPAWGAHLADKPGTVVTREGVPVLAHVATDAQGSAVIAAMQARKRLRQTGGLTLLPAEAEAGIFNEALRKRERPFAERLVPAHAPVIARPRRPEARRGGPEGVRTSRHR